jgi:hypothetical protein
VVAEAEELEQPLVQEALVVMVRLSIQLVQLHLQAQQLTVVVALANKTQLLLEQEDPVVAEAETAKAVLLTKVVALDLIIVFPNPAPSGGSGRVVVREAAAVGSASGVWRLQTQYSYQKNNEWPV